MSVASAAVTVGTSAVAANSADADPQSIEIYNNGSVAIYWGPSDVTTSSGVPIAAGGSRAFDLGAGEVIYLISGTAGQNVRVGRIAVG